MVLMFTVIFIWLVVHRDLVLWSDVLITGINKNKFVIKNPTSSLLTLTKHLSHLAYSSKENIHWLFFSEINVFGGNKNKDGFKTIYIFLCSAFDAIY